MAYRRFIAIVALIGAWSLEGRGQSVRTPFSSFGPGRYQANFTAYQMGAGGLGVGAPDYIHFNTLNPALLTFNQLTTLEAGLSYDYRQLSGGARTEQNGVAGFNYFLIGLPIKSGKWTMGIGITPHTRTEYKVGYTTALENIATDMTHVQESRSGGIDELYWSNGIAITRNLSVGVQGSYFFGQVRDEYSSQLLRPGQLVQYRAAISDRRSFSGFSGLAGIALHFDSLLASKDYQFVLGITYRSEARLKTQLSRTFEQRTLVSTTSSINLVNNSSSFTTLPQSIAAGLSFGKIGQWMVGADFTYTLTSMFKGFEERGESSKDSWKAVVGGRFTPSLSSAGYLKRITYQTGVTFERLPYELSGKPIDDIGWSFGLSLPLLRASSVNLSFNVGKQGNISENGVEEFYFKLYCGVAFSDRWFIRRRFD